MKPLGCEADCDNSVEHPERHNVPRLQQRDERSSVHFWWFEFGLERIEVWTFEVYFFVICYAALFSSAPSCSPTAWMSTRASLSISIRGVVLRPARRDSYADPFQGP
jgi:hypothetical protein